MKQYFKSIYFSDFPSDQSSQKSLTLAFGEKDSHIFNKVQASSSHELRNLLGYQSFIDLQSAAEQEGLSINTYCLSILRKINMHSTSFSQPKLPGFQEFNVLNLDPIYSTFRGGESEPLHLWYPFLEGYSPQFVETIISHYAPRAKKILDPFSGTGTTPITVHKLGLEGYFCEVNPFLQYLTSVKILSYALEKSKREKVRGRLESLADELPALLENALPSRDLESAYSETFGKSLFFDADTYSLVLRARIVLDKLAATEGFIADLATIAVLASLLPSSRLIRSGDIRYRSDKERTRQVTFTDEVVRRLALMACDLGKLPDPPLHRPTLICENAKKINKLPYLDIDLVITSPPYLNGTNYFRNTKIELWFLRSLRSQKELADFRYRAVSAGINDITMGKVSDYIPEPLIEIIKKVEETAYDVRIPKMILSYFQDMELIFSGIRNHLAKGAVVAVDLGDSIYGGVHIPTDLLLVEILEKHGFVLDDLVVLRKRLSRDRTELRQVLLKLKVGEPTQKAVRVHEIEQSSYWWSSKWGIFKNDLPHQQQPYAKRNWGSELHSLCSYQGKMKPSLAHHLVNTFVPPGGRMLDPFAGVGTIPFESAQSGVMSYGFEISPAALVVSSAKVGDFKKVESDAVIKKLSNYISENDPTGEEYRACQEFSFNGTIPDYFHPETLREILLARRYFINTPPANGSENLVLASLLHILHGNRPYALSRRSHPITPYKPTGITEYRALIPRLTDKVERSIEARRSDKFVTGKVFFQDATKWWPYEVDNLDAVITSPPFFDSTRFYVGNWMRLWFCGWEKEDFSVKPLAFVDERQKESFEIYQPIFRQARERLKPGGVMVLHLGLSYKSDMAHELARVAAPWFKVEDIFVEDVTHVESHGIRDKGTVTGHQFLVLV